MSKWRPSLECIYVIPDIHGQLEQLNLILSRILPLRSTGGVQDTLVFLGDYIDRGVNSHKVVDRVIELKKQYPGQIVTLMGNHELMLMDGIKPSQNSDDYLYWMKYGGVNTLSGYLDRFNHHMDNPYELLRSRAKDFIPQEHKDFFSSLDYYYETDSFIFVHGGCDPLSPLSTQEPETLAWDRALYNLIKNVKGSANFAWNKCIVTGHNCESEEPLITPKYMMLDCSCYKKLLVLEVNSMECFVAKRGKKRMVKVDIPV